MIIKEVPEDFRVNEILSVENEDVGNYILCRVNRVSMDHFTMIFLIAQYFKIPEKKVGFAGIKDRNAVITQYLSLPLDCNARFSEELIIQEGSSFLSIEKIGRISNSLSIGSLESNEFEIIIKEISEEEKKCFQNKLSEPDYYCFPNYFGDQRFGGDYNNVRIGYYMIKKEFSKAALLLGLEESDNPLEVLRKTPRRLRMLMISAFQSAIFNAILSNSIEQTEFVIQGKNNNEPIEDIIQLSKARKYNDGFNFKELVDYIPLPGLGMENNSEIQKILDYLSISERDFAIRQMPELMFEPATRKSFVKTNIYYEWLDNNILKIKFKLPKGSYATILIESLFP